MKGFDPKVTPWQIREQDFPHQRNMLDKMTFLLGYAILAPSIFNTQPWQFVVGTEGVEIYADYDRVLKVADWDERNMCMSIGCALENFLIAAEHFGYGTEVTYHSPTFRKSPIVSVKLLPQGRPAAFRNPELFGAILHRQTNHKAFDGRSVSREDTQKLTDCCAEEGISLDIIDDMDVKRKLDELVIRADLLQFADPRWCDELAYWLDRGVMGVPWLLARMKSLAVTFLNLGKGVAKKDSEILMSAPVVAIFSSMTDEREEQVKAGQLLERLWLMATTLGIALQPMNQLLQVLDIRFEVQRFISKPEFTPQLFFRMGFADPIPTHTPRRPLTEVLAQA